MTTRKTAGLTGLLLWSALYLIVWLAVHQTAVVRIGAKWAMWVWLLGIVVVWEFCFQTYEKTRSRWVLVLRVLLSAAVLFTAVARTKGAL